jgi:hypothetical protein
MKMKSKSYSSKKEQVFSNSSNTIRCELKYLKVSEIKTLTNFKK